MRARVVWGVVCAWFGCCMRVVWVMYARARGLGVVCARAWFGVLYARAVEGRAAVGAARYGVEL